jgi:CubicO group peptidase (beta-lactamase class C family)
LGRPDLVRSLYFLSGQTAAAEGERIEDLLSPILKEYNLPALGGAVVTGKGLEALGVVGVRKAGTDVAATADDLWHLGSNTKAMTATLVAALIEQGTLKWETTVGETFADLVPAMPPTLGNVSLLHLLSHRAGLPANLLWGMIPARRP